MLPYIPAIAVASLLLLAVPVYLPRFGLAFSLAGIVYVGRKLTAATRHMAQMEQHT